MRKKSIQLKTKLETKVYNKNIYIMKLLKKLFDAFNKF